MSERALRATSFGAVAADYDRLRPPPADAAVDWLLPADARVVMDLAAGTGLLTRALAARVETVWAVEPDERMRAVLADRTPGVHVLHGWGEEVPLDDASVDAVFVSSAWHWLDPGRSVPELARVLRDGGRLGVVWTSRDRQVGWVASMDEMRGSWSGHPEGRAMHEVVLPAGSAFTDEETASFGYSRSMPLDDVVAMMTTYSGMITASPAEREAVTARARELLREQFGDVGTVEVPMRSRCWRATRGPRG